MATTLQALHDQLLLEKPEEASHDAAYCGFCLATVTAVTAENASDLTNGGSVSEPKTYTEAEFTSAISEVADLKAQLAELTLAAGASEVDAKVAEAVAGVEATVAELQSKLDAAVLEAQAAKDELAARIAAEAEAVAAAQAAEELAARKETRLAQVKEHASFPEDYLAENADRFAAMSDDDFEAALADWKVVAAKPVSGEIPAVTAMTAARTTDGSNPLKEVFALRSAGVDTRSIH